MSIVDPTLDDNTALGGGTIIGTGSGNTDSPVNQNPPVVQPPVVPIPAPVPPTQPAPAPGPGNPAPPGPTDDDGPRQTLTVIGRFEDLAKFNAVPNVDTWLKSGRIPGPGERAVTWAENLAWLDERIHRGDHFGIATDPATLPPLVGGRVDGDPNGYFTARELDYLRNTGIEPIPLY